MGRLFKRVAVEIVCPGCDWMRPVQARDLRSMRSYRCDGCFRRVRVDQAAVEAVLGPMAARERTIRRLRQEMVALHGEERPIVLLAAARLEPPQFKRPLGLLPLALRIAALPMIL